MSYSAFEVILATHPKEETLADTLSTESDNTRLRRSRIMVDHALNQSAPSHETNLEFGYGRHACPRRFLASNEFKRIVARLVVRNDIKMPGGRWEK